MPGGTFALSSLPLAFCFVHAKKKTDILTIKIHSKEIYYLQKAFIVIVSTFTIWHVVPTCY